MEDQDDNFFNVEYKADITGDKLPSKLEVIQFVLYCTKELKLSLNQASQSVVERILVIWNDVDLPTRDKLNCAKQVLSLHELWRQHQKHSKRTSGKSFDALIKFKNEVNDLFDVSHKNALNNLDNLRKEFLLNQRKAGRVGNISDLKAKLNGQCYIKLLLLFSINMLF